MSGMLIDVARLTAWLAILALVFIPLERIFAVRKAPVFRAQTATDLGWYFVTSLLPHMLLVVPTAALAWGLHRLMPAGYLDAMAHLPVWVSAPAILVVGEVGAYWGHRWSHEIPFLWRFHAIHHSAEHMDWLVNTRAHPVDMVFTRLCGLVPIYVLGLAPATGGRADLVALLTILFGTVWGFFIHANVRWRLGPLEWLLATPAFHHWHHTNDHMRDRNYAATLPLMDRIFGTHHLPKEWPPEYGIDAEMPASLVGQLVHPVTGGRRSEPALQGGTAD